MNILKKIKELLSLPIFNHEEPWSEVCPDCDKPMKTKQGIASCDPCGAVRMCKKESNALP